MKDAWTVNKSSAEFQDCHRSTVRESHTVGSLNGNRISAMRVRGLLSKRPVSARFAVQIPAQVILAVLHGENPARNDLDPRRRRCVLSTLDIILYLHKLNEIAVVHHFEIDQGLGHRLRVGSNRRAGVDNLPQPLRQHAICRHVLVRYFGEYASARVRNGESLRVPLGLQSDLGVVGKVPSGINFTFALTATRDRGF